ncbi:hypothetical protein [Paenibacillus sedimenti]|uniref:Uncharacterized protein n=1 Tax=Paenibacillus sedimenti TaxID=2770274 RepID=A0A926KTL3_9BACL|nr:hypothetical protein [Paenibacillus sedimenti]MBD0383272.1 hypothetical protein [Paenibacillus sedimenti]
MAQKVIEMPYREASIIRYLRWKMPVGAPIREVWETLSRANDPEHFPFGIGDNITLQAYHRIFTKMISRGKIEETENADTTIRFYKPTPYLIPENSMTLNDINENLLSLTAPEALAKYIDALDYFERNQSEALHKAAEALLEEEPVQLVLEMLQDEVRKLNETLDDFNDAETRDDSVETELEQRHKRLSTIVHSYYGIPVSILDTQDLNRLMKNRTTIKPNWNKVKDTLKKRVFGDRCIYQVDVSDFLQSDDAKKLTVSGSDGSMHAGLVRGVTAQAYSEDDNNSVLTFNNSIAYVSIAENNQPNEYEFPYHGVPMTRAALEEPSNRGMVLSPSWFPELEQSEYEHMKKSALDVIQYRIDERIITGTARALGSDSSRGAGKLLPRSQVHFRDGSVVPQERELNHYERLDSYGEMSQEGIRLSHNILRIVKESSSTVFAGTVKSTQLKAFSELLNWYISCGSKRRFGRPIDPFWDLSRAANISDNVAMTKLLSTLGKPEEGVFWVTFSILRPFPQLVTHFSRRKYEDDNWVDFFEDRKNKQLVEYNKYGGSRPYFDGVGIEDDAYVRMLKEADYVMFYIGHTWGNPPIILPRYEFMDSLRKRDLKDAATRVSRKIKLIVQAIALTKLAQDTDHNFMTGKKFVKVVPFVVYEAHEKGKVFGHKLEAELKSAIFARLAELKRVRGNVPALSELYPVPIRGYFEQMQKLLPASVKDNE